MVVEPSKLVIRTCRSCELDVSLPPGLDDPKCPGCQGPLEVPADPDGDAQDKTLHDLPSEANTALDIDLADAGRRARGEHETASGDPEEADTATYPPDKPLPVRHLGPYELRRVLGKGGMGIVYEAYQPALARTVALKVIRGDEAGDEELQRFIREARAAAKLQHPNIVPIFEVGEHDGRHFFTMEMISGQTLTALARKKRISPEESARVIAKLARAIHYAHERKIIHRDLKPSNVLIDEKGEPHVMDFGLAKDLSEVSGLTLTGVAMGSPPYMPPEQARGEFKKVDEVSDVYGLGATLYECLTGSPPFKGKSLYDVIAKVLVEEPSPPRKANENIPYDLETICLKALEKEKWRRYPAADELASDLERFLGGETIRAARLGLTTRVGRVIERHKLQIFSVLIPVAVAAALAAYAFGGRLPSTRANTETTPTEIRMGPIADAADKLSRGQTTALAALLGRCATLPTNAVIATSLADLTPSSNARNTFDRTSASPDAQIAHAVLAEIADGLIEDDEAVSRERLAEIVRSWLVAEDANLASLASRTALALRGARRDDGEAFRLALASPLTILDGAILSCAKRTKLYRGRSLEHVLSDLCSDGAPQHALASARSTPQQLANSGVIGSFGPGPRWQFPPTRLPREPTASTTRPRAKGLLAPGSRPLDLHPTVPLCTANRQYVLVGWLRFVYVLDNQSGRILARQRLPGLARGLEYATDGSFWILVEHGDVPTSYGVRLDLSAGVRVQLRDGNGQPIPPRKFVPSNPRHATDVLRRVASALVPTFERTVEAWENPSLGTPILRIQFDYPVPAGYRLDLGFTQAGGTVNVAPRLGGLRSSSIAAIATDGPAATAGLKNPGSLLAITGPLQFRSPPTQRDPSHNPRISLKVSRAARGTKPFRYVPLRRLAPPEWLACADEVATLLSLSEDPNPWLQAFRAAALGQANAELEEARSLARWAARSKHLSPRGRVELGCFLDIWGFQAAADLCFAAALAELTRDFAFIPEWAGYGRLDCGQPLAQRVEAHWFAGEGERALTLTRWRNAFAPALAESKRALRIYQRAGVQTASFALPTDLATPPPAIGLGDGVPKGLGQFAALSLQRLDHAMRLQTWFVFAIGGLLLITFVRYRRHSIRGLSRLGAATFKARSSMWLKRPWVRLRYSWPTFFTLNDKLSLVILYFVFFGLFAYQDAGLDALVVHSRAPTPLQAGLPAEATTLAWVEKELGKPILGSNAYLLAWLQAASGREVKPSVQKALAATSDGRAHLLLAEILLAEGAGADIESHLERAVSLDPALGPRVDFLRARQQGDRVRQEQLAHDLARVEIRLAVVHGAHELTNGSTPNTILAPAPTVDERNRLLLGTDAWWKRFPGMLSRGVTGLSSTKVGASVEEFESAYGWVMDPHRARNRWFFLIPASLILLVASLFMPSAHRFEPLQSDLTPPRSLQVLRLLFPGMPQFNLGRPVRAVLLLLPFLYVVQTITHVGSNSVFRGQQTFATSLSPIEVAALTAENVSALPAIRVQHQIEMVLFLLLVFILHWIDLALSQRKIYRAGARERIEDRLIIPIDSLSVLPEAPGSVDTNLDTEADTGQEKTFIDSERQAGPFDQTEPQAPPPDSRHSDN